MRKYWEKDLQKKSGIAKAMQNVAQDLGKGLTSKETTLKKCPKRNKIDQNTIPQIPGVYQHITPTQVDLPLVARTFHNVATAELPNPAAMQSTSLPTTYPETKHLGIPL